MDCSTTPPYTLSLKKTCMMSFAHNLPLCNKGNLQAPYIECIFYRDNDTTPINMAVMMHSGVCFQCLNTDTYPENTQKRRKWKARVKHVIRQRFLSRDKRWQNGRQREKRRQKTHTRPTSQNMVLLKILSCDHVKLTNSYRHGAGSCGIITCWAQPSSEEAQSWLVGGRVSRKYHSCVLLQSDLIE